TEALVAAGEARQPQLAGCGYPHRASPWSGLSMGRSQAVQAARMLLCATLVLLVSLVAKPAFADDPVEINSEADLVLRPFVRAVIEDGAPLTPGDAAKLAASGISHPSSPPSYGRFEQPVWGRVSVVSRLPRR